MHEGEKSFDCEACGQSFDQKNTLNIDVRSAHNEIFMCPKCSMTYSQWSDFETHMSHMHEGSITYWKIFWPDEHA